MMNSLIMLFFYLGMERIIRQNQLIKSLPMIPYLVYLLALRTM